MAEHPERDGPGADPQLADEDDRARARAVDPTRSFIVQAPAGSGKTGLLVLRLLGLLARVERPEAILAITFTRKAQAEMRQRVIAALSEAAAGHRLPPDAPAFEQERRARAAAALARSRERGWDLLAQPERIGILTIDALNTRLVNRLPVTSGLGLTPAPCEDATPLFEAATHTVLAGLEEGPEWLALAIEQVLVHLDNDRPRLARLLVQMLASRDRWQRHLGVLHDTASLEAALAEEIAPRLAALRARLPAGFLPRLSAFSRWSVSHLDPDTPLARARAALAGLAALPGVTLGEVPLWQAIADFLLKKDGEPRRKLDVKNGFPPEGVAVKKSECREMKAAAVAFIAETCAEDPALPGLLQELRGLPAGGYGPEQAAALVALGRLLEAALAALAITFRARGEIDFSALAGGAIAALGPEDAPTDLGLALDSRIEHILLDEFQDTSPGQVALLARLVAGWQPGDARTLFLVGDPMQSIYGFREAEVGLFLKVWAEARIGAVALERLVLRRNFRSRAGVVHWVNTCFGMLMPAVADPLRGRIAHAASLAAAAERDAPARVEVHAVGDRAAEAARVVELVRAAQERHPGASIALLARTRAQLLPALAALARAGLPVQGVGLETLGARPVVQDLLSLARALAHPGDRLAWLACLRAPWCGLDLASLTLIAAPHVTAPLCRRIAEPELLAALEPGMRERLEACLPAFEAALARRAIAPLAERVERCWLALGGPLCVADEADRRAAWQCLGLMAEADEADLDRLGQILTKAPLGTPPGAGTGLQAMTMHKAKGLEFDVVLQVGLGGTARARERPLLAVVPRLRADGPDGLLVAPIETLGANGRGGQGRRGSDAPEVATFLRAIATEGEREEELRLLYVAATRARRELHLLGAARWRVSQEKGARWEPARNSLLARLWPVIGTHWQELPPPSEAAGRPDGEGAAEQVLERLPLRWCWPELPEDLPGIRLDGPADALARTGPEADGVEPAETLPAPAPARPPVYEWAGRDARAIGSVVHAALQVIATDGLAAWDARRVTASRPHWRARLAAAGLAGTALETAVARVARAIEQTLEDPRGRWCLSPHEAAESEWALSGMMDGELMQRVVDRFLVVDGTVWIIDFKTSSHEGGGLDAFLDNEVERYRPQLEGYARLIAAMDPRPIRLGLYFPLLGGWRSWPAMASGACSP